MVAAHWTLGAILAATAVSASADELQLFSHLLKRQEPGSAAYNCHDNCGQAIIQGRSSADVCNDNIFLTDYKACIQCSGPDNQDIWQYYGTSLSKDASACGLSTTPLSGPQPDVGAAIPAGSSSSGGESTSPATSSATEAPTSEASSSESTSAAGSSTGCATASSTVSTSATSVSSAVYTTHAPTGTGSAGGNGTATTSSGLTVVTNGAYAVSGSPVGFYGALALGALYAAAQ
ncbi:hypothetical protein F4804DRAFT_328887 [Jackrogersella minutella]|nr:hypothetical protein F4804DRAFT_328887 [Jackrogersella minutella]